MIASFKEIKNSIADSLSSFSKGSLLKNTTALFNTLGYYSDKTFDLSPNSADSFLDTFDKKNIFRKDKAILKNWRTIDVVFQLTDEEIYALGSGQLSLKFNAHKKIDNKIYQSYLFVALQLKKGHYTRTDFSNITREINKLFPMPVFILFKNGENLTLSVINRRLHKRDASKDVLEKITLIKDIRFAFPHRAHIEILYDLSFEVLYDRYRYTSFVGLHDAWRRTLDTNELNKRFYKELSDWYFWALQHVTYPKDAGDDGDIRNATNVIRLITRMIFVWFIKEKGLVPDGLFSEDKLASILKFKDPNQSTYYKAILQNLFFATLNQEMNTKAQTDNRKFRHRTKRARGRDQHYMIHNVYRYERYFKNPDEALRLFSAIPFLNGGLFECLDKYDKDNSKKILRIDGFSDRKDNELVVPDFLFFSGEQEADLNKSYGTKNRRYKVKGLLRIFQRYKFTIDENTPIEEEVALDPELLGKAFENLLAAYNPETGVTARKLTGSFYTPREIVDYMVDESLKATLSNLVAEKLDDTAEEDMKTGMDILFAYTEKEHAFNDKEVWKIIEAVSELKILDPACGSGAFPMGTLHKLVYILGKIDPDNVRWRELQKQRAIKETEEAYSLGDKNERHRRLSEIEDAFDFNTSDYGRKLFLIENCIYGIDIQPIAVQIAKLRFFISLVVDQNVDRRKDNFGIRPLPNLETKFIAANTLLGIDKGGERGLISFEDPNIVDLQNELVRIRHKHFISRTPQTKRKWREKDEKVRERIKNELILLYEKELNRQIRNSAEQKELEYYQSMIDKSENDPDIIAKYEQKKQNVLKKIEKLKNKFSTHTNRVARQLASWDPYDQNASADFFDAEWMFNITTGFDVVIGKPPYVRADSGEKHLLLRKKLEASGQYETLWERWDLYIPFIECGYKLLRFGGVTTMIVSDAYCHSKYAQKSQNWFLKNSRILRLDFFSKIKIFEAGVHNITFLFQKIDDASNRPERRVHDPEFGAVKILKSDEQRKLSYRVFFPEDTVLDTISVPTVSLNDICYISFGCRPNSNEKIARGQFVAKDLISYTKDTNHPKAYIEAKDVKKWSYHQTRWLEWGTKRSPALLARPTFEELYEVPEKIVAADVSGAENRAAYDSGSVYHSHTLISFVPWYSLKNIRNKSIKKSARYCDEKPPRPDLPKREDLERISQRFTVKFLLAIMNSSVAHNFLRANRRSNIHLYPNDWKRLPFPDVSSQKQKPIDKLVDKILSTNSSDISVNITHLEAEIDARVAHLYELTEENYSLILSETSNLDTFRVAALNIYRDISTGKIK
jgi:hypothetical protein